MNPVTLSDAHSQSLPDSNFVTSCSDPIFWFHQLTPLHRAARRGRKDVVEFLVEHGAGIENEDNHQVHV